MKRGEVWVANLNPSRGRKVGKIRPVLIILADVLIDAGSPTIAVLPLTTNPQPGRDLLRVPVSPRDRLEEPSHVLVDQPRSVDRRRFGEGPLARLSRREMDAVTQGLRVSLGMF